MLEQLKHATTDSELTQPLNEEERKTSGGTAVFEAEEEENSQIIVEESNNEEIDDTVNVISKDRSYMLSYLVAK